MTALTWPLRMEPFPRRPQPQLLFRSNHVSLSLPPQPVVQGFIGPQTGSEPSLFSNDFFFIPCLPSFCPSLSPALWGALGATGSMQDQPSQQPACPQHGLHHFWVSFLHLELHPGLSPPVGSLSPSMHARIPRSPPPPTTYPDIQPGHSEVPNRKCSPPTRKHGSVSCLVMSRTNKHRVECHLLRG